MEINEQFRGIASDIDRQAAAQSSHEERTPRENLDSTSIYPPIERKTSGAQIGDEGTEQFTVKTRLNGEVIREQVIHDPFINTTVKLGGWRAAWMALRGGINVEVEVRGSEGAQRAILTLDPKRLAADTEAIAEARRQSRLGKKGDVFEGMDLGEPQCIQPYKLHPSETSGRSILARSEPTIAEALSDREHPQDWIENALAIGGLPVDEYYDMKTGKRVNTLRP
jgi:hypothetical protein